MISAAQWAGILVFVQIAGVLVAVSLFAGAISWLWDRR